MRFNPTPKGSGHSRAKYRKAKQGVEHHCFTLLVLTNKIEIMEEKIEKFKELMKAKHNCQFCLDHVTGSADMHGLVYWAERVEKLRQEVAEML